MQQQKTVALLSSWLCPSIKESEAYFTGLEEAQGQQELIHSVYIRVGSLTANSRQAGKINKEYSVFNRLQGKCTVMSLRRGACLSKPSTMLGNMRQKQEKLEHTCLVTIINNQLGQPHKTHKSYTSCLSGFFFPREITKREKTTVCEVFVVFG